MPSNVSVVVWFPSDVRVRARAVASVNGVAAVMLALQFATDATTWPARS